MMICLLIVQISFTLSAAILLLLLTSARQGDAVARTIKIPLIRETKRTAGQFGQPIASYYTPVDIGTPPKEFNIQFDAGLGDPFVPHYTWSPFKINLHYSTGFQCKLSSTCKRDDRELAIQYQNCKLTGKPYEDVISFRSAIMANGSSETNSTTTDQPLQRFSIRQKFLAISDASDARFKDLPVDGFFGLSPQPASRSAIQNLLVTMQQANLIDNMQFSFWFNPVLDSNQGGELTLGGVDQSRYQGQVYWHHLNNPASNEWSMNIQFVTLGNQYVSCLNKQCQASISTSVNDFYGPPADVSRIYQMLNSTRFGSLEIIDCNRIQQLFYLSFSIDGIPYALLPTNYIRHTADGRCYVAIFPNSNSSDQRWLLGTNFLGAYYSTFDMTYKQIGFATMR